MITGESPAHEGIDSVCCWAEPDREGTIEDTAAALNPSEMCGS